MFDRRRVDTLKEKYPVGCRVKLVEMDDPQAPPEGALGTVKWVNDIGSLLVVWDNGSSLNVLDGVDRVIRINNEK